MAGGRMREAQAGHPADPSAPAAHLPVLYAQVMEGLGVVEDGRYLDGTFGRGGHARGVLEKLGPGGRLLLMDKDPEAIAEAERSFGADGRVSIRRGSFAALGGWDQARDLDGVLFDLGVSSPQLDVAQRGFSFGKDGPLDMRMDPESGESAAQWLARADEREIADVLWTYGEEKQSRRIARAIVALRGQQPLERTAQLADLIGSVVPRGKSGSDKGRIHPATRSFQAIRIHINAELAELINSVVPRGKDKSNPATRSFQAIRIHINRELADLEAGLDAALAALRPGGRLAVISFHSLEDRIVKQFIARHAKAPPANRRLPQVQAFVPVLVDRGGAIRADAAELAANPRARSAVLRVAEKLDGQGRLAA